MRNELSALAWIALRHVGFELWLPRVNDAAGNEITERAARVFGFMKAHEAQHRIATMCRVLDVSPSGYYAWLERPASQRARERLLKANRTAAASCSSSCAIVTARAR